MLILTTAKPSARFEDDRVILTIPSGEDHIEIVMKVHEALHTSVRLNRAGQRALSEYTETPQAQVIPFPKKRRKRGRA